MSDELELKFLGPPEVALGGRTLKFATRKALALFAYLVVEGGVHPREKLLAFFWPESETHLAQSALRNTLARIKDALRGVDEPLRIEGDRVGFNAALASFLDLELVAKTTTESQPLKVPQPNVAGLENASKASRGLFLEGFSLPDSPAFDEWLIIQRANWGHRQNLLHDRLSLHQLEHHLIQPAIETVIRWLISDSLNESAYQRLMRLHFLNGDRSAALQTYETCRTLLKKELGIEPSAETEATLAYIRSGETPASVFAEQAEAREEAFHIPFVGRSHEYQGLVQAFHLIQKGRPQVVVVSGESGIGKTRLSEEFLKWAGTEGADVLRGRAFETSGQLLPYQPIIDSLRERLERENAPEDLLDDAWLAELTRILPELRERYPDLPPTAGNDATARARLFEAIARLAEALSAKRPLIWLMDDLQWADAETLELLHYLSRNWRKSHSRILLLILMRSEALGFGATLRDWMSGLTRDIQITRFSLSAMNMDDLGQLIASMAGENAVGTSEFSAWLTAETSGQPFFLTETLTALDEYGALIWVGEAPASKLDIPATLANLKTMGSQSLAPAIRDVVVSRLEWLSQSASSILAAAAVIGRNCSFERLCQISGIDVQDSLNALDELLLAHMILEIKNEARPYTISHDRIREIVYTQLSEARQLIFHRRALAGLTESKAPPAELAHHALSAKEWPFAFQHSLQAGKEAMRLFATAGAIQHFETARSLLYEKKTDAAPVIFEQLYMSLGKAYEMEFHHREALNVYEEMQAQASARDNRKMELAALVARCVILPGHYDTQNLDLARELALQALPLAQELGDLKAQAEIEMSLAMIHKYSAEQIEPTIGHLRAAEALARKVGSREQLGMAMLELGVAFLWLGQLEQAESLLLEATEIHRELDYRPRVLSSLHNLAIIYMETGKFDTALISLQEAYQTNQALGSSTSVYALATTHNVIHILCGKYDLAFESLLPALEMAETQIVAGLWIDIFQQLAWCCYDLGAYAAGIRYCRKAIEYHDHINSTGRSAAFAILAILQIHCGDLIEAEAAVKTGWENFDIKSQNYPGWWETHSILAAEAELALAKGELARATRCVDQLLEKFNELNLLHLKPSILYLQARILKAAGNQAEAVQSLTEALALADEMGAHREVWAMCSMLGKLEAEQGNKSAVIQLKERVNREALLIADHAGTEELREIFLSRPDVQKVLVS
ncbi:MAG: AAA family ATPase [Anaerolineales bacterium]|nr:AAA family ATPase [Anaerolineales bacterium]